MTTFSELLLDSYRDSPDKVSMIILLAGHEDQPLTYRQLVDGAAVWANTYEHQGVQPGEVVVLILQHGLELIFAYWGAILHGAIPSIMPFLTEKLQPDRYRADLSALVDITQPECIVTYREFEAEVRAALPEASSVRRLIVSDELVQPEKLDVNT
ncbi:MAG: AMP-binding protein, partial [Anaerolineaceae bacterium]